jgi:hypothetical protein
VSLAGRIRLALEIVRALGSLALIELSLRTSDLPTTCRRLGLSCGLDRAAPPPDQLAVLPRKSRTAVLATDVVLSHWPVRKTCLRQCLLLGHRLRTLAPVLRIGVRRDERGMFSAHSWLEIQGRALDPMAWEYSALGSSGR